MFNEIKKMSRLETHYLLSNIKGIMIILLVLTHFLSPLINGSEFAFGDKEPIGGVIFISYLAFAICCAVPIFVMIVGYGAKDYDSCRETAFGMYFVPYIVLTLLMSIELTLLNGKFHLILFSPLMQLWFFLAMFVWMLIVKDVARLKHALVITFAFSIITGVVYNTETVIFSTGLDSFGALSQIVTYLPFLVLGTKITDDTLAKLRSLKKRYVLITAATAVAIPLICSCVIFFSDTYKMRNYEVMKASSDYLACFPDMTTYTAVNLSGIISKIIIFIFCIACAILAVRFIPKKKIKFLTAFGDASLTIFSLHEFIVMPITYLLTQNFYITLICSIPATLAICWLLSLKKINRTYTKIVFKVSDAIKIPKNK